MKRKTFRTKDLPSMSQKYKGEALNNPLYIESLEIRRKFLETAMHQADNFTWKLVNDFIACTKAGWVVIRQLVKVREAVIKYGSDSGFWSELNRTKSLRNKQTLRLSNLVRIADKALKEGGLTREIRNELYYFKKVSLNLRKKLLVNPFTEEQWKIIYKIERICGVYYSDLSPEDNGEIWKGIGDE